MTDKIAKTDTEWKTLLSPEQYEIARRKGTERAFTGALWNNKAPGTYACICCGTALVHSADKYDSGSGWPSFTRPTAAQSVGTNVDRSHGMERVEVVCARCDAHLGHVFPDGPAPTGLRYCINSASLRFDKA